jgi:hypothetical protein
MITNLFFPHWCPFAWNQIFKRISVPQPAQTTSLKISQAVGYCHSRQNWFSE